MLFAFLMASDNALVGERSCVPSFSAVMLSLMPTFFRQAFSATLKTCYCFIVHWPTRIYGHIGAAVPVPIATLRVSVATVRQTQRFRTGNVQDFKIDKVRTECTVTFL